MSHQPIVITDIEIPFLRLVGLIVKFALASIPAMFIVALGLTPLLALMEALFGAQ